MMRIIQTPVLLVVCACLLLGQSVLLGGCRKNTMEVISPATARINFYNASEELAQQAFSNGPYLPAAKLLIDSQSGFTSAFFAASPYFNSNTFLAQFPNTDYNAKSVDPWIRYMRMTSGLHSLQAVDTALAILYDTSFRADDQVAKTILFTDSLGVFRVLEISNEEKIIFGSVRLRFLQMSPDSGPVQVQVNGEPVSGWSDAAFGSVSKFVDVPAKAAADTFRIRIFSAADTSLVITRTTLYALSGNSYNIMLSGYYNPQFYVNKQGTERYLNADLKLQTLHTY